MEDTALNLSTHRWQPLRFTSPTNRTEFPCEAVLHRHQQNADSIETNFLFYPPADSFFPQLFSLFLSSLFLLGHPASITERDLTDTAAMCQAITLNTILPRDSLRFSDFQTTNQSASPDFARFQVSDPWAFLFRPRSGSNNEVTVPN